MTKWLNILSHQLNPSQTTSGFPPTSFRVVIIGKKKTIINAGKVWGQVIIFTIDMNAI